MSRPQELLKKTGRYSAATQIAQAITILASVLSRQFLGPRQTGIWATLQIVVDYSKHLTLGTLDAALRQIPYAIGKGETSRAEELKNAAFSFVLSASLFISGGIVLFALFFGNHFPREIQIGLYLVAVIILGQRLNNTLISFLRCYKQFEIESSLMIYSAVVNALLVGFLSYSFKIYGFIGSLILSFVFNIVYAFRRYSFRLRWNLNPSLLNPMIRYGLPVMTLGIFYSFLRSLDKIFVAKGLGFEAMGYYSIAVMVTSYISNYGSSVAIVILPYLQEKLGQAATPQEIEPFFFRTLNAYALTVPLMIGITWAAAPFCIHLFLPQFVAGIPAMKVLTLSMFFLAISQSCFDFLIAIKKFRVLFPALALCTLLSCVGYFGALRSGGHLRGIAWVSTGITGIFFLINYAATCHYVSRPLKALRHLGQVFGFFLYAVLSAWALTRLAFPDEASALQLLLRLGGLSVCYFPLLYLLNRDFGLAKLFQTKFSGMPAARPLPAETLGGATPDGISESLGRPDVRQV